MAIRNLKRDGLTPGIIHKKVSKLEISKMFRHISPLKMKLIIFIFLIAVSSLNAKALAVASDYLEGNILALMEGSSRIYSIRLQNPDSYEARFKVNYDRQFMKAMGFEEEYVLPPQSTARIEFNVTAPKYDEKDNLFAVSYTVHQLSGGRGGTFFLTKISKNFKLKVEKKPDENPGKLEVKHDYKFFANYNYAVYAIAILAFLLYILGRGLLKKTKHRKDLSKTIHQR